MGFKVVQAKEWAKILLGLILILVGIGDVPQIVKT